MNSRKMSSCLSKEPRGRDVYGALDSDHQQHLEGRGPSCPLFSVWFSSQPALQGFKMAAKVLGITGGHTRERRNHSFLYVDRSSEKVRAFPGCLQRPELTFHGLEGFHSLTPKPMPVEPKGIGLLQGGTGLCRGQGLNPVTVGLPGQGRQVSGLRRLLPPLQQGREAECR